MLQVRENEIPLRKWSGGGGGAQLRTLEGTLVPRLDGARGKKRESLAPLGSKCTVLKKVLAILLEFFSAHCIVHPLPHLGTPLISPTIMKLQARQPRKRTHRGDICYWYSGFQRAATTRLVLKQSRVSIFLLISRGAAQSRRAWKNLAFFAAFAAFPDLSEIHFKHSKQTFALRQASEESACNLLSFFCDD